VRAGEQGNKNSGTSTDNILFGAKNFSPKFHRVSKATAALESEEGNFCSSFLRDNSHQTSIIASTLRLLKTNLDIAVGRDKKIASLHDSESVKENESR